MRILWQRGNVEQAGGWPGVSHLSHLVGAMFSSHGNFWRLIVSILWRGSASWTLGSILSLLGSMSFDSRTDIARFSDPCWSILGFLLLDSHISFARFSCSFLSILGSGRLSYITHSILGSKSLDSRIHVGRFSYSFSSMLESISLTSHVHFPRFSD